MYIHFEMDILKPDKSSSGQGWRSSVIMTEITTLLHTGSSGESSKKRIFYSQTDCEEEGGTIFGIRVFFMNANVVFIEKSEYFLKTFKRP